MPQSPRMKGLGSGGRAGEEEFVLYLQGIPAHCRWQELKDFVRQSALHIRQAVVYDDQHGYSTGLGQIIVKNEDEAWRTYRRLSTSGWDGQALTVTLARASSPTRPIAGPTRSPAGLAQPSFVPSYSRSVTAPSSPISPDLTATPSTTYPTPDPVTIVNYTGVAHSNMMPLALDSVFHPVSWHTPLAKGPTFHAPQATAAAMFPATVEPTFSLYQYQMPVLQPMYEIRVSKTSAHYNSCQTNSYRQYYHPNSHEVYDGNTLAYLSLPTYPILSARDIIIHSFGHQVTWQTLKQHFHAAGVIERCDILPEEEGKSSRRRGYYYATATFRTEEEAKRAVALYDRSVLMGSRIRVRLDWDADSTTSTLSTPIIPAETSGDMIINPSDSSETASFSINPGNNNNHTPSRRDSSKELLLVPPKKADAADGPPHQPLVVNGSNVRKRAAHSPSLDPQQTRIISASACVTGALSSTS